MDKISRDREDGSFTPGQVELPHLWLPHPLQSDLMPTESLIWILTSVNLLITSFPFGMHFLFLKIIIDWPKANKTFREGNPERVQAGETLRFTWSLLDMSQGPWLPLEGLLTL